MFSVNRYIWVDFTTNQPRTIFFHIFLSICIFLVICLKEWFHLFSKNLVDGCCVSFILILFCILKTCRVYISKVVIRRFVWILYQKINKSHYEVIIVSILSILEVKTSFRKFIKHITIRILPIVYLLYTILKLFIDDVVLSQRIFHQHVGSNLQMKMFVYPFDVINI